MYSVSVWKIILILVVLLFSSTVPHPDPGESLQSTIRKSLPLDAREAPPI